MFVIDRICQMPIQFHPNSSLPSLSCAVSLRLYRKHLAAICSSKWNIHSQRRREYKLAFRNDGQRRHVKLGGSSDTCCCPQSYNHCRCTVIFVAVVVAEAARLRRNRRRHCNRSCTLNFAPCFNAGSWRSQTSC